MNSPEQPVPSAGGLTAGQTVGAGRFLLKKQLGFGGMGVVWLAHDLRLGEPVALKFLPPQIAHDPAALEDMRRETLRARKLSHPNIIRIHDFIQPENEPPFIAMEYVDGPNLHFVREARHTKVLPWSFLAPIVRQLCAALDYAHSEKVVHRDLKPANLMLDSSGRLRLADFGLARVAQDSVTRQAGMTMAGGTINFMSPQQAEGQPAQPSDDIYSLGATLYDLLTSRPPFYEGDVDYQVRHNRPAPMSQRLLELGLANEIPSEVSALVMACLAKGPEQRPLNAKAVLDFLDAAEKKQPAVLVPTAPAPAPTPPAAPLPVVPVAARASAPEDHGDSLGRTVGLALAGAVLFVVLGIGIGGGWWWFEHTNRRGPALPPSAQPSPAVPPTTGVSNAPIPPGPVVNTPPVTPPAPPVPSDSKPNVALPTAPQSVWEACATLPDGRVNHSAIWTGKELLVWGGGSRGRFLNDGAAFNPETKRWRAISSRNAPSGRWCHATVWTGREMIVWGGRGNFYSTAHKNDGGRYNPETDSWTPIPAMDALEPRSQLAAVWTGEEMVVWGGMAEGEKSLATGGRYRPSDGSWTLLPRAGLPEARVSPLSVWTGREMIVWGGLIFGPPRTVGTGGCYNPRSNTWRTMAMNGAPAPVRDATAVWTGKEMIVWGGGQLAAGARVDVVQRTGARYDPVLGVWHPLSTDGAPTARLGHSAVWTGGEMIVWGGGAHGSNNRHNTGGRYNPATDEWRPTEMEGVPASASFHSATWTGQGMLVLNGSGGFTTYNTLHYYHPPSSVKPAAGTEATATLAPKAGAPQATPSSWAECPTLPDGRIYHSAVWTGSELIVWGGGSRSRYLNDGAAFNPATKTWRTISSRNAPSGRWAHATVWTGREMIVWGGRGNFQMAAHKRDGGRYNPATDTWTPIPPTDALPASSQMAAVWTGEEMLVWGGVVDGGQMSSSGARYNPANGSWTPLPRAGLEPRMDPLSVWTGREMMVWGGFDHAQVRSIGTGARYDPTGNTWRPVTLNGAPSTPRGAAGVWTGQELLVWGGALLAPGSRINEVQGHGARYDPAQDLWRPMSTDSAPAARFSHTAVWTGTEMIVWGGMKQQPDQMFNTGGRYNPAADRWTPTAMEGVPAPNHTYAHTATWTGNGMLVFNGSGGFSTANTLHYYHPSSGAKPTAAASGGRE